MKGSVFYWGMSHGKNKPRAVDAINNDYSKLLWKLWGATRRKKSHQPRWSCRFYTYMSIYLFLSLSFARALLLLLFYSHFISLASDNRAGAIRAESHRHACNADVPLCNRSLIVSWLIALHHYGICIIKGVQEKLHGDDLQSNVHRAVYVYSTIEQLIN